MTYKTIAAACHFEQSEERERSRKISNSFTLRREAGTGFSVREALLFV
jgi:hypothetical protein